MRTTKARTIIVSIINSAHTPLDAASILEQVQHRDSSVNRATVFRNLNSLTEAGEVKKVDFGEGKSRYEMAGHHHHHLICTECKSIEAVDICRAEKLVQDEADKKGFRVTSHQLEYFGLCSKCQ